MIDREGKIMRKLIFNIVVSLVLASQALAAIDLAEISKKAQGIDKTDQIEQNVQ